MPRDNDIAKANAELAGSIQELRELGEMLKAGKRGGMPRELEADFTKIFRKP